jgi:hypothetical protein
VIGTPELTILVPCATCGGKGRIRETFTNPDGQLKVAGHCYDCYGTGVTRTPVTCAACRWFSRYGKKDIVPDQWGVCLFDDDDETDPWIINVHETHGCTKWTAKEATGNGN